MEEEFILVTKKNKRKKIPCDTKITQDCKIHGRNEEHEDDNEYYEKSISRIITCRDEIQASNFWTDVKESLENFELAKNFKAEEIISYGAGNFTANPIARYQFGFLLLLAEHLKLSNSFYIYDPMFTVVERKIIDSFGFKLIQKNEECRHETTKPTIVFMLHCGKKMYDNFLQSNWSCNRLENILIVGNSFSSYFERFPAKILQAEAPYLYDIIPFSDEHKMKNSFIHTDIFNDTSYMTFPKSNLSNTSNEFWTKERPVRTVEDDTEIILKSKVDSFR